MFYIICINLLLSEKQTVITGNHRTRDYIILQELYSNQSDSLKIDTNESTFDKNALMSLDIFHDVHINITDSTYTIHVMEKPNLEFIMPLIDKDETLGFSFGLGLYLNAIKGKNQNINFSLFNGAIESYRFNYDTQINYLKKDRLTISAIKNIQSEIENRFIINTKEFSISYYNPNIYQNIGFDWNTSVYENILEYNNFTEESIQGILSKFSINKEEEGLKFKNYFNTTWIFSLFNNSLYENYINFKIKNNFYYYFNNNTGSRILFKNIIELNSSNNIPEYSKIYIGGENHVRGYHQNPNDNSFINVDKLKSTNILLSTIQFELPFYWNETLDVNKILFFIDYAIGSNTYNRFDSNNSVFGYGFGFRMNLNDIESFDICIGLNEYGYKTFNFIFDL